MRLLVCILIGLLGLALSLGGIVTLAQIPEALREGDEVWLPVSANLTGARVAASSYTRNSVRHAEHLVMLDYRYEVAGQTYSGSAYALQQPRQPSNRYEAERMAAEQTPDTTIAVFRHPVEPQRSRLVAVNRNSKLLAVVVPGGALLIFGLTLLWLTQRLWRPAQA